MKPTVLLAVLGICSAVVGLRSASVHAQDHGHPTPNRPRRWRHIDPARPVPRTLAHAVALHTYARRQVGMQILRAGGTPSPGLLAAHAAPSPSCGGTPGPLDPVSFGADPSGNLDSTAAFARAMAALTNTTSHANDPLADCIANLGGATLDLGGGEYLISAPLVIPPHVGNVRIRGGTLRASPSFPSDRFLIEVGEANCASGCDGKPEKQGVCNEMIGLDSLFLDASHIAAGGVLSQATMGTTVGPSCFFIGFNEAGLRVNGGHETILSDSWLAEYYWSDHRPGANATNARSIAVELNGQDNFVSNVIVFDYAKMGVLVNGAASILTGVHTWNGGGVGISINGSYGIQDRIVDCYLDYNSLDLVQPSAITVENTFFLDTHANLFPDPTPSTGWNPRPKTPYIEAVVFRENVYSLGTYGGNASIVVVQGDGAAAITPGQCKRFVAEDEISLSPMGLRQTRATKTLWKANATEFVLDFTDSLVFPWIDTIVSYTVMLPRSQPGFSAPLVQHAAEMPFGSGEAVAVVRLSSASDATVTVSVAQCV